MIKKEKNRKFNLKIKSKDIDPGALLIVKRLSDSGYEALVVGGCIRNLVMGEEAHDWDITTSATPKEISRAFKGYKVVPVGEKYGTIMVVIKAVNYQVTTFRGKDKLKGIEETEVAKWTSLLLEDLKHRDFTINTLVWVEKEGVLDYFKGLEDIKRRVIKGVEDPSERIKEDPLRMLRAIRLSCELDFKIDKAVLQAIEKNSPLIKKVSQERIRDELIKILLSNFPKKGIQLLHQLGLLKFILPEIESAVGFYDEGNYKGKDLFSYILDMADNLSQDLALRLSILLHDIEKSQPFHSKREITDRILHRLRFKNSLIKKINVLIRENWQKADFSSKKNIRQLISRVGVENILSILELKKNYMMVNKSADTLRQIDNIEKEIRKVLQEIPPLSLKDLALTGQDLKGLGYPEGKKVGQVLKELLNIVLEEPALNQKKRLLAWVKSERPPGS